MATRAEIIDAFFRRKDYFPWIVYRPIGEDIVSEVERMGPGGLYLSTACALIEKESGGKNIFGCDWGSRWTNIPPYCQVAVTEARVKALIRNVNSGGGQNGVGVTQLTSIDLVKEAERIGGAHIPRFQMRVGFRYLNDLIARFGWPEGAAAYNAGPGNYQSVMATYGADMARLERRWARRLMDEWKRTTLIPPGFTPQKARPGTYQDRHPTRYNFRPDVADVVRRIYRKYPDQVHINTYRDHPEGYWRTPDSFDVWGPGGRNDPLDTRIGDEIRDMLFDDPRKPDIDWIIWRRWIWSRGGGWQRFGDGPFTWHDDHIHTTFV